MKESNKKYLEGLGKFTVILASICIVGYVCWFWGVYQRGVSNDPAIWGAFGDYIGGRMWYLLPQP